MHTSLSLPAQRQRHSYARMVAVFFSVLLMAIAPGKGFAQTAGDQQAVLQQCIDLPGLQQFYPKNADGSYAQLYIYYYHPLLFPTDLQVVKDNKPVILKEIDAAIGEITNPFFLFNVFEIDGDTANADYNFYYTQGGLQHSVQAKVTLQKSDGTWTITKTEIKN